MKLRIGFLVLALAMCSAMAARGQEKKAPVVLVDNAPDNRAGFEAFARMGLLPLPPGSRPVGGHIQDPALVRKEVWIRDFPITAWQAPVSNDVVRLLVDNHWVSFPANRILGENSRLKVLMEAGGADEDETLDGDEPEADWEDSPMAYLQDIDLDEALNQLFASLRKEAEENAKRRNRRPPPPDQTGALLVFANRLHQIGETNAANQLSAHLFHTAGKRETLMAGVNFLADDAYHQALETFFRGGTVEDLIRDAEAVRVRFRQGWRKSAPVGALIGKWKKSLEQPAGALPAVEGVELSERQQAFYRQFLDQPALAAQLAGMAGMNWLLSPKSLIGYDVEAPPKGFISPMDLRLEAIPPLRVMLADARLLPFSGEDLGGMDMSEFLGGEMEYDGDSFPRPLTLAECAAILLASAIPGMDELDESEAGFLETLGEAAMDFYTENKGKDRFAWAKATLEASDGEWNLPQEALLTLLASGNAADRGVAESFLLQSKGGFQIVGDVLAYAKHIGDGARPFVKQYVAGVESEKANELRDANSYVVRMLKPLKEWMDPQAASATAPGLENLLEEFLAGKTDSQELVAQAGPILKERSAREQQEILLPVIHRAPPDAIPQLLQFLMGLSMDSGWDGSYGYSTFADYLDPDAEPENWDDVDDMDEMGGFPGEFVPVAELWLPLLAEPTHELSRIRALSVAFHLLGRHLRGGENEGFLQAGDPNKAEEIRVYLEFARKVLALSPGERLKGLPGLRDVSADRRKEILAILQAGEPDAILGLLGSPNWSERMFALRISGDPSLQKQSHAWSALSDKNWNLAKVSDFSAWQGYEPPMEFAPGKTLGVGDLAALMRQAQTLAKTGRSGTLMLNAQPAYRGLILSYQGGEPQRRGRGEEPITVMFRGGKHHNFANLGLDQEINLDKPEGKVPGEDSGDGFEALLGGNADLRWKQFVVGLHEWRNSPHPPVGAGFLMIQFQANTPEEEKP